MLSPTTLPTTGGRALRGKSDASSSSAPLTPTSSTRLGAQPKRSQTRSSSRSKDAITTARTSTRLQSSPLSSAPCARTDTASNGRSTCWWIRRRSPPDPNGDVAGQRTPPKSGAPAPRCPACALTHHVHARAAPRASLERARTIASRRRSPRNEGLSAVPAGPH